MRSRRKPRYSSFPGARKREPGIHKSDTKHLRSAEPATVAENGALEAACGFEKTPPPSTGSSLGERRANTRAAKSSMP
jgi:hypothetical protein